MLIQNTYAAHPVADVLHRHAVFLRLVGSDREAGLFWSGHTIVSYFGETLEF